MATNHRKPAAALFELIDKSTLKVPKNASSLKIPNWWSSRSNTAGATAVAPGSPPPRTRSQAAVIASMAPLIKSPVGVSSHSVAQPPHLIPVIPMTPAPQEVDLEPDVEEAPAQQRLFDPPPPNVAPVTSPSIRPPSANGHAGPIVRSDVAEFPAPQFAAPEFAATVESAAPREFISPSDAPDVAPPSAETDPALSAPAVATTLESPPAESPLEQPSNQPVSEPAPSPMLTTAPPMAAPAELTPVAVIAAPAAFEAPSEHPAAIATPAPSIPAPAPTARSTPTPKPAPNPTSGVRVFAPQTFSQDRKSWNAPRPGSLARLPGWALLSAGAGLIIFLCVVVLIAKGFSKKPTVNAVHPIVQVPTTFPSVEIPRITDSPPAPAPAPVVNGARIYAPGTVPYKPALYYVIICSTRVQATANEYASHLQKNGIDVAVETTRQGSELQYTLVATRGFTSASAAKPFRDSIVRIGDTYSRGVWKDANPQKGLNGTAAAG